jgi:hypothetical protein
MQSTGTDTVKMKKIMGGALGGMCIVYGVSLIFRNLHAMGGTFKSELATHHQLSMYARLAQHPVPRLVEYSIKKVDGEALSAGGLIHGKPMMRPLVPRLGKSVINEMDGQALAEFFDMYACPPDGPALCILDLLLHSLSQEG